MCKNGKKPWHWGKYNKAQSKAEYCTEKNNGLNNNKMNIKLSCAKQGSKLLKGRTYSNGEIEKIQSWHKEGA